jgi:hypothetical protein
MNQYLLFTIINVSIASWLLYIYYFFIITPLKLYLLMKKNKLNSSLNFFAQYVVFNFQNTFIYLRAIKVYKKYKLYIDIPISSDHEVFFDTKYNPNSDFFLFSTQNIYVNNEALENYPEIYNRRSKYHKLFKRYEHVFSYIDFKSISFTKKRIRLKITTKNLLYLISNFFEIFNFIQEMFELLHANKIHYHNILSVKKENHSNIMLNKNLLYTTVFTLIIFTLIGLSLASLESSSKLKEKIITKKLNTYIQLWEIYAKQANVYDFIKNKKDKDIGLIAKNTIPLEEYAGFKPELMPWGFRITPRIKFAKHYKILVLPKETKILGYINYEPEQIYYTKEYQIIIFDISMIKKESFIKIYMKYRGDLAPLNIKEFRKKNKNIWKAMY